MSTLRKEYKSAPPIAVPTPSTLKPAVNIDASLNNAAFITKVRRPKLRMLKGRANTLTKGFIKTFMNNKANTAITAEFQSVKVIPLKYHATNQSDAALRNIFKINLTIYRGKEAMNFTIRKVRAFFKVF